MSRLHLKIVCIGLLFLICPFLSYADTVVYYGTTSKKAGVFFYSKSIVAITDNRWLQMSIYNYPLFREGQREYAIATLIGKMGDIIFSGNVDGTDVVAVHFYAEGKTSSDDVMIMTLDQNGMIVTFDYCVNTPDNGFESKLFMKVDRQIE